MISKWLLLILIACSWPLHAVPSDNIRAVLQAQQQAWNEGDLDTYMQGYWNDPQMRFVSNGKFRYGWQETLAAYKKHYPDAESLGVLLFTIKDIKMLSNYSALVVGRWQLTRVKDMPGGVFTLLMEKIDGRWVITHDHTSS
ncbi:DUF4440 domain-containing protein [Shewanella sp. NIFS-20-20]|uniref:YybH family protein n=1 Tax=Shewanella sp. NIFS-20-20 TaxID=2853806 RepID=UPI001C46BE21|nr:nuclear transport factor 2 family protein [Shewanella sp. NIFS-20-20]MBV7316050.1 DUF4440 domain-containing protein [Shewanella sp. NIFS-20-20]